MSDLGQQFDRLGTLAWFERDNDEIATGEFDRAYHADAPQADVATLRLNDRTDAVGVLIQGLDDDLPREGKPRIVALVSRIFEWNS